MYVPIVYVLIDVRTDRWLDWRAQVEIAKHADSWLLAHYRDDEPPPALDMSAGAPKSDLLTNLEKVGAKVTAAGAAAGVFSSSSSSESAKAGNNARCSSITPRCGRVKRDNGGGVASSSAGSCAVTTVFAANNSSNPEEESHHRLLSSSKVVAADEVGTTFLAAPSALSATVPATSWHCMDARQWPGGPRLQFEDSCCGPSSLSSTVRIINYRNSTIVEGSKSNGVGPRM